jgi:hypothetical protein
MFFVAVTKSIGPEGLSYEKPALAAPSWMRL